MTALSSGHFSIQTSCQWVKLKSNKLRMIHGEKKIKSRKKNWKPNKHRTKLSVIIYSTHHKKSWKKQRNTTNLFHASLSLSRQFIYFHVHSWSINSNKVRISWVYYCSCLHLQFNLIFGYRIFVFFSFPSIICLVCISFSFRRITLDTMKSEHFNCLHDLQAFQWHFDIFVSVLSLIL